MSISFRKFRVLSKRSAAVVSSVILSTSGALPGQSSKPDSTINWAATLQGDLGSLEGSKEHLGAVSLSAVAMVQAGHIEEGLRMADKLREQERTFAETLVKAWVASGHNETVTQHAGKEIESMLARVDQACMIKRLRVTEQIKKLDQDEEWKARYLAIQSRQIGHDFAYFIAAHLAMNQFASEVPLDKITLLAALERLKPYDLLEPGVLPGESHLSVKLSDSLRIHLYPMQVPDALMNDLLQIRIEALPPLEKILNDEANRLLKRPALAGGIEEKQFQLKYQYLSKLNEMAMQSFMFGNRGAGSVLLAKAEKILKNTGFTKHKNELYRKNWQTVLNGARHWSEAPQRNGLGGRKLIEEILTGAPKGDGSVGLTPEDWELIRNIMAFPGLPDMLEVVIDAAADMNPGARLTVVRNLFTGGKVRVGNHGDYRLAMELVVQLASWGMNDGADQLMTEATSLPEDPELGKQKDLVLQLASDLKEITSTYGHLLKEAKTSDEGDEVKSKLKDLKSDYDFKLQTYNNRKSEYLKLSSRLETIEALAALGRLEDALKLGEETSLIDAFSSSRLIGRGLARGHHRKKIGGYHSKQTKPLLSFAVALGALEGERSR